MQVGDRIKDLRHAMGMTQEQFASRVGLSKATLVGYEVGQRRPGSEALAAIAKTGVNMTWLLTGEGEMFSERAPDAARQSEPQGGPPWLPPDHPRAKRWEHLVRLVEQIEDAARRDAILAELFARAQEVAEIDELRRAVRELRAARKAG